MKRFVFAIAVFASLACLSGCSSSEAATEQAMIEERRREAEEFLRSLPLVKNQQVANLVNGIGKKLLAQPTSGKKVNIPISFHVLNLAEDSGLSTSTLGGLVFLDRAEIETTNSESEIAGVLGHEIAHNYLGHTINKLGYEWCMEYLQKCEDWHYQSSREQELAADDLGVILMAKAGYDPEDLAINFLKSAKEMDEHGAVSFPSHPSLYERVKRIRKLAKTLRLSPHPPKKTITLQKAKKALAKIKPR